jgi:hypothetical protein
MAYCNHVDGGGGTVLAGALVSSCYSLVGDASRIGRRTNLDHAFGGEEHIRATQGTVHDAMGFKKLKASHNL